MVRKVVRFGIAVVALVALLGAAGGGLFYAFNQHFYFAPPKADYPKPASALQAQRQDIDYFRTLMELDRSFSPGARSEAERRIAELQQLPSVLPLEKLHVALMQVMTLADNGHTKMRAVVEDRKVLMAPVRIAPFAEGFYVMRAKAPYRDMLGGRLVSIDGVPFDQVLKAFETLRGGLEAFRRGNAAAYIADQELLYGLGTRARPDRAAWTVRLPDGRTVTYLLIADPEQDQPPVHLSARAGVRRNR